MLAIFEREFKSYFKGVVGYIYTAFILIVAGISVSNLNLQSGYANFEYAINGMTFIFLIAVPILTMRIIADERHQKTDLLLYSLPISMTKVVIGKYLALLAVLAVPMLVLAIYPLILSGFGAVHLATAYSTLLAFFLMGAALVAIGLLISALTENQVIAAVVCLAVMLVVYFISYIADYFGSSVLVSVIAFTVIILLIGILMRALSKNTYAAIFLALALELVLLIIWFVSPDTLAGSFPALVGQLSLFGRFENFVFGMFDVNALLYYLSVIAVFVFLTIQVMEKRRWS